MIFHFIIYGLLGWNLEVIWTGLWSFAGGDFDMVGHTSLWMFFIYSAAGVLFEKIHERIRDKRWYERGLIWMYLIFVCEFLSGFLLSIFGVHPWIYDGTFNVLGLIRLDYAPVWFFVGLLFEMVHDFLPIRMQWQQIFLHPEFNMHQYFTEHLLSK